MFGGSSGCRILEGGKGRERAEDTALPDRMSLVIFEWLSYAGVKREGPGGPCRLCIFCVGHKTSSGVAEFGARPQFLY